MRYAMIVLLICTPCWAQTASPSPRPAAGGPSGNWLRLLAGQWRFSADQNCQETHLVLTASGGYLQVRQSWPRIPHVVSATLRIESAAGTTVETVADHVVNGNEPQRGDRIRYEFFPHHWTSLNRRTGERVRAERC